MDGAIYLLQENGALVRMVQRSCDSEDVLQTLLAHYPALLAGDQIDSSRPRRWLLIGREVSLPAGEDSGGRWAVDHLFLDQEGVPTLVEVKRSGDARLRREVVGQLLDYAAHAVHSWSAEHLARLLEERCRREGLESKRLLAELLERCHRPGDFWERVGSNLETGRVRLVFVAEQVPPELARVVTFLNTQMRPAQVLAVEVRRYCGGGLTALVPRVLGHKRPSGLRRRPPAAPKQPPVPATFFALLETRRGVWEAAVAHRLTEWAARAELRLVWEKAGAEQFCRFLVGPDDGERELFSLSTAGEIEIVFEWCGRQPPFDRAEARLELRARLNALPGIHLPVEVVGSSAVLSLGALLPEPSLHAFLDTLGWILRQTRGRAPLARVPARSPGTGSGCRHEPPGLQLPLATAPPPSSRLSRPPTRA